MFTDDRYVVLCYVRRSEVDDGCTHVYTNVKRSEVFTDERYVNNLY